MRARPTRAHRSTMRRRATHRAKSRQWRQSFEPRELGGTSWDFTGKTPSCHLTRGAISELEVYPQIVRAARRVVITSVVADLVAATSGLQRKRWLLARQVGDAHGEIHVIADRQRSLPVERCKGTNIEPGEVDRWPKHPVRARKKDHAFASRVRSVSISGLEMSKERVRPTAAFEAETQLRLSLEDHLLVWPVHPEIGQLGQTGTVGVVLGEDVGAGPVDAEQAQRRTQPVSDVPIDTRVVRHAAVERHLLKRNRRYAAGICVGVDEQARISLWVVE